VQGLMLADVAVVVVSALHGEYENGMQGWHPLPMDWLEMREVGRANKNQQRHDNKSRCSGAYQDS
jgi:hypothetical protein